MWGSDVIKEKEEEQDVYVVGMGRKGSSNILIGIFTEEDEAIAACRTPQHWYGPVQLNVDLGDEEQEWPGGYKQPIPDEA